MLGKLVILFILLPIAEMYLLLEIGLRLGVGNTVVLIVMTGVFGAFLYKTQSHINFVKIANTVQQGIIPDKELFEHLLIIIGAVLLMTPGLITDFSGFLLLIPFTRPFIRKRLKIYLEKKVGDSVEVRTYSPI